MQEFLEIGQIVNTYGIKGFVKVVPYTDNPKRFEDLKTVYIVTKGEMIAMTIETVSYQKNCVLLKFKEISDINQVEKYKNCLIKIARKDAVSLPDNSYFIADLIGMEVYTMEGNYLGTLIDVFKTGSNDVYVVKAEDGKQTLLPAIKDVIKTVDIENKKMTVNLLKGLE